MPPRLGGDEPGKVWFLCTWYIYIIYTYVYIIIYNIYIYYIYIAHTYTIHCVLRTVSLKLASCLSCQSCHTTTCICIYRHLEPFVCFSPPKEGFFCQSKRVILFPGVSVYYIYTYNPSWTYCHTFNFGIVIVPQAHFLWVFSHCLIVRDNDSVITDSPALKHPLVISAWLESFLFFQWPKPVWCCNTCQTCRDVKKEVSGSRNGDESGFNCYRLC